jgi:hypothetical protein
MLMPYEGSLDSSICSDSNCIVLDLIYRHSSLIILFKPHNLLFYHDNPQSLNIYGVAPRQ